MRATEAAAGRPSAPSARALAAEKARAMALQRRYGGKSEILELAEARAAHPSLEITREKLAESRNFHLRYRPCSICGRFPAVALEHYRLHESGALDARGHVTDPVKRSRISSRVEKLRQTVRARRSDPVAVGIRELKASLSAYVTRVKNGETLTITEHGAPVARLIPAGVPAGLEDLVALGRVSWPAERPEFRAPPVRLRGRKTAADLVIADRA
jgi:prevent-host-death family protein